MARRTLMMLALTLGVSCLDPNDRDVAASYEPSCDDNSQNNDETDVDCGGSCAPCSVAKRCEQPADCESLSCAGECIAATCSDAILNGSEVQVDCGGPACAECDAGGRDVPDAGYDAGEVFDAIADAGDLDSGDIADAGADVAADMHMPVCGDAVVEGIEECDDGNDDDTDDCINCVSAACGDGVVQTGSEDCDDGNAINTDDCVACVNAVCGDGVVWNGVEDCDDDGESANCDDDCTLVSCGDGVVNSSAGEQCESVSGCGPNCRWEPVVYELTMQTALVGLNSDCSSTGTFPHTCALNQAYGFAWLDATPYQPSGVRVEFHSGNYCSTSRLKDTMLNGAASGQFVLADVPCTCESPSPPLNTWDLFSVQSYAVGAMNSFTMVTENGCEGIAWSGQFYARITVTP